MAVVRVGRRGCYQTERKPSHTCTHRGTPLECVPRGLVSGPKERTAFCWGPSCGELDCPRTISIYYPIPLHGNSLLWASQPGGPGAGGGPKEQPLEDLDERLSTQAACL